MNNICVKCGWCCTVRACGYGEWDDKKHRCIFLTDDNICEKYDAIVALEKEFHYPMFGCGCSSSLFNTVRDAKIQKDSEEK